MIMINYIGKKCDTLLFFFRLAKKIQFYLISGALDMQDQPGAGAVFMQQNFSSILGYQAIVWYSNIRGKKRVFGAY
jgi:hypothetical protein